MVTMLTRTDVRKANSLVTARQISWHGDANISHNGLSLLYCMDTSHGTSILFYSNTSCSLINFISKQPFVDAGHPLHDFFPPRVWAIRIPVILILLGSAVVGSFLGMVMIRSNRKKAAKAKAVAGKKKA